MKTRVLLLGLLLALCGAARAEIVDRIVAVVGKKIITLSEVEEANRFEALVNREPVQPLTPERARAVTMRLVDQLLLEQEIQSHLLRNWDPRQAAEQDLAQLRKVFGSNGDFHQVLARYNLTEDKLLQRFELQSTVDKFLEARFRPGVQVDDEAVERYYQQTLVPQMRAQGATQVPPLDEVRELIEEILVQQRVNSESAAWLQSLRSQARVQFR